ncbi:hypothetical protein ACFL3X_01600 [Gemmatimonadota bacterium]
MLKYLLVAILGAVVVRFLNNMVHLGREGPSPLRPETEEAEFEILPDDPEPPSDRAG